MRLIDADLLITRCGDWYVEEGSEEGFIGTLKDVINYAPTIEPERKKGKWIWLSSTYDRTPCEMRYMCSECHHEIILHSNESSYPLERFCPNCGSYNGADMRGET